MRRLAVFASFFALILAQIFAVGCMKPCATGGACPQQTHEGRGATTPAKPACVTYAPIVCLGSQRLVCETDAKGCAICDCVRAEPER
ncbi:MAG: hypothetical protein ACHREM_05125 [Polyangiales bacterium]